MKTLLTLIFLFTFSFTQSQNLIGYKVKDIDNVLDGIKEYGSADNGLKYLSIEFNFATMFFWYEIEECMAMTIVPNEGAIDMIVKDYNEDYINISENVWKTYDNKGSYTIILVPPGKTDFWYFMWTKD